MSDHLQDPIKQEQDAGSNPADSIRMATKTKSVKTKRKLNQKKWIPHVCISCNKVIKPDQKRSSVTKRDRTYFLHEECYDSLKGRPIGGRPRNLLIDILIAGKEDQYREYYRKKEWNEPKGYYPDEVILDEVAVKRPKAHVLEFEPSIPTKEEQLDIIIREIRDNGPLTSEQIAAYSDIKRNTVTWRLWDHIEGNEKSKINRSLFHVVGRGPKGVQIYDLTREGKKE